jgi:hypothetical protein
VQELLKTIVLDLERLDNQEIGEIHKAQVCPAAQHGGMPLPTGCTRLCRCGCCDDVRDDTLAMTRLEAGRWQDLLGRVMVVWAFDHPSTSYKQGVQLPCVA